MWLQVGREANPSIPVPPECTMRLASPSKRPLAFSQELKAFLKGAIAKAYKGEGYEVIVLDGLSEFGTLFEAAKEEEASESKWEVWRAWKKEFVQVIQLLNPEELGAWVICTARIRRPKETDIEWLDDLYMPDLDGWAKERVGYYFSGVFYTDVGEVRNKEKGGEKETVFQLHVLPKKGYWIKNAWAREWREKGLSNPVLNPTFDMMLDLIKEGKNGNFTGH